MSFCGKRRDRNYIKIKMYIQSYSKIQRDSINYSQFNLRIQVIQTSVCACFQIFYNYLLKPGLKFISDFPFKAYHCVKSILNHISVFI